MRPDVASDVGDMILTFAFLSLAPYVVNVFIVALHKGVRSSTKLFMVGAFFPCLPGMTMYRLGSTKNITLLPRYIVTPSKNGKKCHSN